MPLPTTTQLSGVHVDSAKHFAQSVDRWRVVQVGYFVMFVMMLDSPEPKRI